jgi:hypothetical protein
MLGDDDAEDKSLLSKLGESYSSVYVLEALHDV